MRIRKEHLKTKWGRSAKLKSTKIFKTQVLSISKYINRAKPSKLEIYHFYDNDTKIFEVMLQNHNFKYENSGIKIETQ